MALYLKQVGHTYNMPIKYYECDAESDKANVKAECSEFGTRCFVIKTNKLYALDSDGAWQEVSYK